MVFRFVYANHRMPFDAELLALSLPSRADIGISPPGFRNNIKIALWCVQRFLLGVISGHPNVYTGGIQIDSMIAKAWIEIDYEAMEVLSRSAEIQAYLKETSFLLLRPDLSFPSVLYGLKVVEVGTPC